MKLEDYLEELTDNNWHTLRKLIEYQLELLEEGEHKIMGETYQKAIEFSQDKLWGNYIRTRVN